MNGRCFVPLALLVALSAATELSAQSRPPAATAKGSSNTAYSIGGFGNEARYRVMEELAEIGLVSMGTPSAEFRTFLAKDLADQEELVKVAGVEKQDG